MTGLFDLEPSVKLLPHTSSGMCCFQEEIVIFDTPKYKKLWCSNAKMMRDYIIKPGQMPKCTCFCCMRVQLSRKELK